LHTGRRIGMFPRLVSAKDIVHLLAGQFSARSHLQGVVWEIFGFVKRGVGEQGRNIKDLLGYWKLVGTSVAGPFVVPGFRRYDKKVRAGGTKQHG
jgi:hypothetical protein